MKNLNRGRLPGGIMASNSSYFSGNRKISTGLSPGINYSSQLLKKRNKSKKEEYAFLISALNFACTEAWRAVQ